MKPLLSSTLLAGALLSWSASVSFAQDLSEADLAALRYFLSIGDTASTEAEIERLKSEFPGVDVVATVRKITNEHGQVDTTEIWQAIEADDYPTAHKLISQTEASNPGWTAPPNMIEVLRGREGQARFELAYENSNLLEAMAVLEEFPEIVTCERINNPWRLADLQIAAELNAEALETYEGILRSCSNPDFVVATLQKSSAIGEKLELEALFEIAEDRNPNMLTRLAELRTELFGPAPTDQPQEPQVAAANTGATGASRSSYGGGGSTRGLRAAKEAADREDWPTCLRLTANSRSLALMNQRAWCALNYGRPREALQLFQTVAQGSRNGSVVRDARYGMSLAYSKLGLQNEAQSVASRTDLTPDQRRVTSETSLSQLALESYKGRRYREALQHLDRLAQTQGSLDRGMAMIRGWSLAKLGRTGAARQQFINIHRVSPGDDSARAIAEVSR